MTRAELDATLAEVREDGYASNRPFDDAGYLAVAVPVRRAGRVVAGFAVAIPTQRLQPGWEDRAVAELTKAARKTEASFQQDEKLSAMESRRATQSVSVVGE